MSTGSAPGQNIIDSGVIKINADLTDFNKSIAKIPENMRTQARATMSALQRELDKVRKDFDKTLNTPVSGFAGGVTQKTAQIAALAAREHELAAAIKDVTVQTQAEARANQASIQTAKAKAAADRQAIKDAKELAIAQALQSKAAMAAINNAGTTTGMRGGTTIVPGQGGRSQQAMGQRSGNFGYMVLMASQAIEDAQYGLSAIVNNIPGIAMASGMSPLVAGGLSIGAVVANQVSQHYGGMDKALGAITGRKEMGNVQSQIGDLTRNTGRTPYQDRELRRLTRIQGSIEDQQRLNPAQTSQEEGVNTAIVNRGYGKVAQGVRGVYGDRFQKGIDEFLIQDQKMAQNRVDAAMEKIAKGDLSGESFLDRQMGTDLRGRIEKLDKANDAVTKAYGDAVAKFMAEIGTDEQKLKEFIAKVEKNPTAFGADVNKFVRQLKEAQKTPEQKEKEAYRKENIEKRNDAIQIELDQAQSFAEEVTKILLNGPLGEKAIKGTASPDELAKEAAIIYRALGKTPEEAKKWTPTVISGISEAIKVQVGQRAIQANVGLPVARRMEAEDAGLAARRREVAEVQRNVDKERHDIEIEMANARLQNAIRNPGQEAMNLAGAQHQADMAEEAKKIRDQEAVQMRGRNIAPGRVRGVMRQLGEFNIAEAAKTRRKEAQDKMNENRRRRLLMGSAKGRARLTAEDAKKGLKINVAGPEVKVNDAIATAKEQLAEARKMVTEMAETRTLQQKAVDLLGGFSNGVSAIAP